jgi:hypothetical protein
MIMESIGDDVAELTTTQIADELGLAVDALTLKPFADTPPPSVGQEILFTGYDIYTYDELSEKLCTKRLEEWPDGPI